MMRKKSILFLILTLLSLTNVNGNEKVNRNSNKIDKWEVMIQSIIHIESKGNEKAISKNGKCIGAMQIKKVLVDDCNRILELNKLKKRFTYDDRYNLNKSIEMFNIIQKYYNKSNNIHDAIRLWNGGCGWKKNKSKTDVYYNKVMKEFNLRYKKMEANLTT